MGARSSYELAVLIEKISTIVDPRLFRRYKRQFNQEFNFLKLDIINGAELLMEQGDFKSRQNILQELQENLSSAERYRVASRQGSAEISR